MQFNATAHALRQQAADPQQNALGGVQLGFSSVLHSWGQALLTHLHTHVVIPGGGFLLNTLGQQWVSTESKEFFLESDPLADVYRDYYLHQLRRLHRDGELVFSGDVSHLADAATYERFIDGLAQFRWVIHCGSPEHCHQPEAALRYLARYVVGSSISNTRMLSDQDGIVTIRMKDYRDAGTWKQIEMRGVEFVRRFLMHVMPASMARVRYHGFLGNPVREKNLARARQQLGVTTTSTSVAVAVPDQDSAAAEGPAAEIDSPRACPTCGQRALQWIGSFPGTYGWHARVSLVPRRAKERLIRERQAALAGEALKVPP